MDRKGLMIGFLAGGWLATVLVLLLPQVGLLPARAGGGGIAPQPAAPQGAGAVPVGPTVTPISGGGTRGIVNPGLGTSDSNNRAIALSASIGGGASAVYYFDTEANRLCVYQYTNGSKGGLRLLAARSIEWDLKLETYRDLSEKSPQEMREAYERAMEKTGGRRSKATVLPTKKVSLPGGGG
jgi:hypothetical protein